MINKGKGTNKPKGYKSLKIYKLAHKLAIEVHKMTLDLPRFENFEEGSQIRRSSKSVSSNIAEGYSLRGYKKDYLRYLNMAYASCQETIEHLDYLSETKSLESEEQYHELSQGYGNLVRMLYTFNESVARLHKTE